MLRSRPQAPPSRKSFEQTLLERSRAARRNDDPLEQAVDTCLPPPCADDIREPDSVVGPIVCRFEDERNVRWVFEAAVHAKRRLTLSGPGAPLDRDRFSEI